MVATLIFLGFATWIATSIIVEGEIFRDAREAFERLHDRYDNWLTYKLRYLIQCHLCTGIWVAGIVALFSPQILPGFAGWVLTALTIKGIAHLILVVQKVLESRTSLNQSKVVLTGIRAIVAEPAPEPGENRSEIDVEMFEPRTGYQSTPLKLSDCPGYNREVAD